MLPQTERVQNGSVGQPGLYTWKTQANKQRYYGCFMTSQGKTRGYFWCGAHVAWIYREAVWRNMVQIIHKDSFTEYTGEGYNPAGDQPRLCLTVTISIHHRAVLLGSIKACWFSALIQVWGNVYPRASYCMAFTQRGGWDLMTSGVVLCLFFRLWCESERWVWGLVVVEGAGLKQAAHRNVQIMTSQSSWSSSVLTCYDGRCSPSGLLLDVAVSGLSFAVIFYVMVRPLLILPRQTNDFMW